MSECPPPDVVENAPVHGAQALTPEAIEAVLADFRDWLHQLAAQPAAAPGPPGPPAEPIDLHTLLGQFIALRHEVNLQTKASRAQQANSSPGTPRALGALTPGTSASRTTSASSET